MRENVFFTPIREQQVAWHFHQHVAEEEDACADAVGQVAETHVLFHVQLRNADVDASQEREHVAEEQERNEPARDLGVGTFRFERNGCFGVGGHDACLLRFCPVDWPDGRRRPCRFTCDLRELAPLEYGLSFFVVCADTFQPVGGRNQAVIRLYLHEQARAQIRLHAKLDRLLRLGH
jgi:hypothetical protein